MISKKALANNIKEDVFLIAVFSPILVSIFLVLSQVKSPNELFKFNEKKMKPKSNRQVRVKESIKEPPKSELVQANLLQSLNPPSMSGSNLSSLSAGLVSSAGGNSGGLSVSQGEVSNSQMVNQTGGENRKARASNVITPKYPQSAQARGITGFVVLDISLNERGQVISIKVASATPPNVFDNAAIEAVQKWSFEPAIVDGRPVPTILKQKVNFELD